MCNEGVPSQQVETATASLSRPAGRANLNLACDANKIVLWIPTGAHKEQGAMDPGFRLGTGKQTGVAITCTVPGF